jgi:RNA polymerase sigma-70 factor (ECF subfamily)
MSAPSPEFTKGLIEAVPALRAFAISLTGNVERADDLVQETVLKAWAASNSFQPGTHLKAWLFTILRNHALTQFKKRKREVEDVDGALSATLSSKAEQEGSVTLNEMRVALAKLPEDQREAVLLVGGAGFSYEEVAEMCGTVVGTIKSRVSRGRSLLAELMYGDSKVRIE